MRVRAEFYNENVYHKPEVVLRIVAMCNTVRKSEDVFLARVAHQLKCLVIKRYRRNSARHIPLCAQWEEYPELALKWLCDHKRIAPRRLDIIRGSKEYSPETIITYF